MVELGGVEEVEDRDIDGVFEVTAAVGFDFGPGVVEVSVIIVCSCYIREGKYQLCSIYIPSPSHADGTD